MNDDEIKKELESLLNLIPVTYSDISTESSEDGLVLRVESEEAPVLIGYSGETLSAVNHILRRIAETRGKGDGFLVVDVNDYRKKTEERIKGAASILGERVMAFRHSVEMEPMSAYERRVVHTVFQDHPNIETESEGFGKFRRVVLKYSDQKEKEPAEKASEEENFSIT